MNRTLAFLALAMASCLGTKSNPRYCDGAAVTCQDPAYPYCNIPARECETTVQPGDLGVDLATDGSMRQCTSAAMCVDPNKPICSTGGECVGCSGDSDCAAPAPRCQPSGACVACHSATEAQDCSGATPVCDTTSVCRRCQAHGECSTGVCKTDGSCAAATDVVYANNNAGAGCSVTGPGTAASPYCEIQAAATAATTAGKPYVAAAGSPTAYTTGISLSTTTAPITLAIIGPGRTATHTAKVAPGIVTNAFSLSTLGSSATVTIDGVELVGQGAGSAGAKCNVTTGTASLTIRNCLINTSGGAGVDSSACTITVDANVISGNQGAGISCGSASTYVLTNNIVANNGSAAGSPGILVNDSASTGTIAFNTLVKNGGLNTVEGGVVCPASGGNKIVQSSIVINNSTSASGTQFAGKCQLQNVVAGTDSTTDAGAIKNLAPAFASGTDFHLMPGADANVACCIDKITTDPGTPNKDHDVDLSGRKKGLGWDYGAHEVQ